MNMQKHIYWRTDVKVEGEGMQFANVHVLVGYNQRSITDYQAMAAELRKTFPQAQDGELHCENVRESSFRKGFTLLTWNATIPRRTYAGWDDTDRSPEYRW